MAPGLIEPEPAVSSASILSLRTLTDDYDDTGLTFYLNGGRVVLNEPLDPEITLLEYLRGIGLTGTKLGCAEGGCGACTVVISQFNPTTKKIYHASVNACLAPLVSVDGKHVITVEGIGNMKNPHPAQERIAKSNDPSELEVEEAFDGNLCRCTGYRPILDAAHTFSTQKSCKSSTKNGGGGCCMESGGPLEKSTCCSNGADSVNGDKNGQVIKRFVPPGMIEYNPDTELIFPPSLMKHEFKPLAFGNKRKRWLRPVTLQQLLEIKNIYPPAKVIGGSTETQIEIKFKAMQYTVSVYVGDIAELRQFTFHDDHVEIGGNVTLTDLEEICLKALDFYGQTKGQPFRAIHKQIRYFAGRQIRNVGTPAGNLATASPISDLNPVFIATNSVLVAKSLRTVTEIPMTEFFKGYRTTALPPDAVIASIRIPVARGQGEYLRAYKQAKRKDDDIAIVNSALRVSLDDAYNVESANLVYGGMAPTTISANTATTYLEGKRFTDPSTLEGTMSALGEDFDLRFGVPGGMATYRKALALGFFYRFYNEVLSEMNTHNVMIDEDSHGEIERAISKGTKDLQATQNYAQRVVGNANPHLAAVKQCTGEAQYTDDIPVQRNELYGHMVLSTKAHAKILEIDPSPAMTLSGVMLWVDHNDLPNPEANWWGAPNCDEIFFAVDEVFTAGQPIGMILADSAKHAEDGARAVKVRYEDLPAIFTIEEAIAKESYFQHYRYINKGDTETAFKEADHVFTGVVRMGGQEHFYLETQACVVVPKPEDVIRHLRRGSQKAKRPVRCMLNRDDDIMTSGQRHPFLARWKVAVNKDGKLQALDADVFANAGWTQDLSGAVIDRALSHSDGCYLIPNVHVRGRLAKTNTVSNTAFRGFGGPQGMFIAESYMEEIADHLAMPVEKLREINFYKPHEITHFNQELKDWHVPLMYQQVLGEADYAQRRKSVDDFNAKSKWKKRGLALIPTKFGISFTAIFLNQAGALVHIYHDGSVLVAHGGTEMGQGLHTKMTMIAAQALGVPLSDVFISETATNTVANTSSTAASASSDLNGYAVYNACEQLNERLKPYREKLGNEASLKALAHAAYFDRVNLSANGFYKTPDIGYVWGPNTGQMFFYFTQGVTAAEVEIDTLTGDWTCLRADIKMDVGRSINPAIDYGQIEGAFVQGQGLFTTEESLWHRASGQLFTRGPGTYKIPGFRDIPQEFNVSLLKDVEWENLRTIQRSRGVGEPPLFMGSSVFFAIRDALKASRKQYGVGEVLQLQSPATPERIRVSCVDPIIKRSTVEPKVGEKSFFISI
ncbi:MAG: hypothetical protein Q9214_000076 [Letrouitia sp. 1 TL-2023]